MKIYGPLVLGGLATLFFLLVVLLFRTTEIIEQNDRLYTALCGAQPVESGNGKAVCDEQAIAELLAKIQGEGRSHFGELINKPE